MSDKLKIYHNGCCHQTSQNGDILQEGPTCKVLIVWFCDFYFLLWDFQVWNTNNQLLVEVEIVFLCYNVLLGLKYCVTVFFVKLQFRERKYTFSNFHINNWVSQFLCKKNIFIHSVFIVPVSSKYLLDMKLYVVCNYSLTVHEKNILTQNILTQCCNS